MIRYIVLDQQTAEDFNLPTEDRILSPLGSLNVFAGLNNAGKSRLLRTLFYNATQLSERRLSSDMRFWNEKSNL